MQLLSIYSCCLPSQRCDVALVHRRGAVCGRSPGIRTVRRPPPMPTFIAADVHAVRTAST